MILSNLCASHQDGVVFYDSYVLPEDIPQLGRRPHHSTFELIRTDDKCKEFQVNIVKPVNVFRQHDFKAKFPDGVNTD